MIGGTGYVAERLGLRVELLTDIEEIGISESVSDPGEPSPPLHLHRRHVESFYVLEGEMTLTIGDRELRAVAGTWAQVPTGTPHTFAFTGDDAVRFLNLHTPSCGYGAFLRGLHEARTDEELAAVRAAFDQEPGLTLGLHGASAAASATTTSSTRSRRGTPSAVHRRSSGCRA